MSARHPIIWVIGATRSCKSAIAENGIAPIGYKPVSTATYFREQFGKADTMSRDFVFRISDNSAALLAADPNCHVKNLQEIIGKAAAPLVIEGERNPVEFSKLYNPKKDMVILLNRLDVDKYDTVIERGIKAINLIAQWNVSTGITPRDSVLRVTFGSDYIKAAYLGVNNGDDEVFLKGPVPKRKLEGSVEDKYPWINIVIGLVRERIKDYYKNHVGSAQPIYAPTP